MRSIPACATRRMARPGCHGSYHGFIDLVELDPKTGQRLATNSPVTIIAGNSEASDIIHHGNYFYLFVNHGSCCQGSNSTYSICVGRAEKITGPYIDRYGDDFLRAAAEHYSLRRRAKTSGPVILVCCWRTARRNSVVIMKRRSTGGLLHPRHPSVTLDIGRLAAAG